MSIRDEEEPLGPLSLIKQLRRILGFIKGRYRLLVGFMIASVLIAFVELCFPMIVRVTIDDYLLNPHGDPQASRTGVIWLSLLYFGLLVVNFAITYGVTYGQNHMGQTAVFRIRCRLWHRLVHLPTRYFDENPVGRLVTRVTHDPANLSELFSSVLATAASDLVTFIGVLVMLFVLDANTSLYLLLLSPAILALLWWFKRASRRIYRSIRVQLARLNTHIQESFSGLQVIRSFIHENRSNRQFTRHNEEFLGCQTRLIHVFSVFRPAVDVFGSLGVALVIWRSGSGVLAGSHSTGTLVAFLLFLKLLFRPLQNLADKFNILQSAVVSNERVMLILDTPQEESGPCTFFRQGEPEVCFENVSFQYEPKQPVLKGVSFHIKPGEKVALVGPSGSGKSTLISLLMGFYPLPEGGGQISVCGRSLSIWNKIALRKQFAWVQQDLFLFSDTLRNNVELFETHSPDSVEKALGISRLASVLARIPDRLEHRLGERGMSLSQGERQLVSFARALVCGGPILVLDEATSSVDSATEALIQEALEDLLYQRTALIVAHRLSTVRSADRILVMKRGCVVEQGSHTQLVNLNGLYKQLYNTQFAASIKKMPIV
jgi:ATP-binding cassette subfamily B protein